MDDVCKFISLRFKKDTCDEYKIVGNYHSFLQIGMTTVRFFCKIEC